MLTALSILGSYFIFWWTVVGMDGLNVSVTEGAWQMLLWSSPHPDFFCKKDDIISPWYDPVIPLLGIYLKKMETLIKKDISTHVHCSVTDSSQDIETTEVSISGRWLMMRYVCICIFTYICKHTYTHNKILLHHEKEENPAMWVNGMDLRALC